MPLLSAALHCCFLFPNCCFALHSRTSQLPAACLPACLQVGDLLDRGDHELPLLFWLERLQRQAAAAGGAIHVLNGEGRLRSWYAAAL